MPNSLMIAVPQEKLESVCSLLTGEQFIHIRTNVGVRFSARLVVVAYVGLPVERKLQLWELLYKFHLHVDVT